MKDIYYADKRDIVKWGGIVYLCSKTGIKNVLQVAYYRRDKWPKLSFEKETIDLPEEVKKHFRDIKDISRLARRLSLKIKVISKEFKPETRTSYHRRLCKLTSAIKARKIVFLDPDVGLASNIAKAQHVKPDEINMIWETLSSRDFLVFYQHRFRFSNWVEKRRNQLAEACKVEIDRVRSWAAQPKAKQLPEDVVFFFIEK